MNFINPVGIYFGLEEHPKVINICSHRKAIILCSKRAYASIHSNQDLNDIVRSLRSHMYYILESGIPNLCTLNKLLSANTYFDADMIISIGGGSALDYAKCYKLYLGSRLSPRDFLECLCSDKSIIAGSKIRSLAIPTIAGTGSEVTPYATIWDLERFQKYSLHSSSCYFDFAYINPILSESVSSKNRIYAALDAFNQASESIWNTNCNDISYMYAVEAIKLSFRVLPQLLKNDLPRSQVQQSLNFVSILAGIAISQTQTALCHSISYPLTYKLQIPHGLACAFTTCAVLHSNIPYDKKGYLERLEYDLKDIGHHDDLHQKYVKLLEPFKLSQLVREYVHEYDDIWLLADKMLSNKRAANNLNPAPNLSSILESSWL